MTTRHTCIIILNFVFPFFSPAKCKSETFFRQNQRPQFSYFVIVSLQTESYNAVTTRKQRAKFCSSRNERWWSDNFLVFFSLYSSPHTSQAGCGLISSVEKQMTHLWRKPIPNKIHKHKQFDLCKSRKWRAAREWERKRTPKTTEKFIYKLYINQGFVWRFISFQ